MKSIMAVVLIFFSSIAQSIEIEGIHLDETVISRNGDKLVLAGAGLREKFWVDAYVGSLYLATTSKDLAEILSSPKACRIQLDFIYKEVSLEELLSAWREGFIKNQSDESQAILQDRIDQFYSYFKQSAVRGDRFILEYAPAIGTSIIKNEQQLGVIPGEDFRNAMLEIWLGNYPADSSLKEDMFGLN
ncbi:MAG: hypothetical protein ACI845_000575 [Gammaproteobacteria bacterium]|jgi:hypothetical protein